MVAKNGKPQNDMVLFWRLQDIETTIGDAAPEEMAGLHPKLLALSENIASDVETKYNKGIIDAHLYELETCLYVCKSTNATEAAKIIESRIRNLIKQRNESENN